MEQSAYVSPAKYELTLLEYPHENCVQDVCELIYQSQDKNLLGALSSLPYTIGRSFGSDDQIEISKELRRLKIAHVFKSISPDFPDIEYYPTQAVRADNPISEIPTKKRRVRIPMEWMLAFGILISVSAFFVVREWFPSSPSDAPSQVQENTDFRAQLKKIVRNVEYRKDRDLLWNKAMQNLGLHEQDAVRTFSESFATLHYQEGTRVIVRPNTLVVIGENDLPENRRLRLEDGSVRAKMDTGKSINTLSIETNVGTIEIKSPEAGKENSTQVETKMTKNGQVSVAVSQGAAVLKPTRKDAPSVTVAARQQITATPLSVSAPTPYVPSLQLFEPTTDATLSFNPLNPSPIQFRWENLGEAASYQFQMAGDPEMKVILFNQNLSDPQIELNYLDLGTVYWSVKSQVEGTTYQSPIWRLHVQKHDN